MKEQDDCGEETVILEESDNSKLVLPYFTNQTTRVLDLYERAKFSTNDVVCSIHRYKIY